MRIARSPLARRIVAFVAAVVIVHAAFYAGPRWWYSRPRVYPQAYEKAVEALKEVVGPAAVERGVFAIAKEPVWVPYEGRAVVKGSPSLVVCLAAPGRDSYLIWDNDSGGSKAAWISRAQAEEAWAAFQYLHTATAAFPGMVPSQANVGVNEIGFVDATWYYPAIWTSAREAAGGTSSIPEDSVRHFAYRRLAKELSKGHKVAGGNEMLAPALTALVTPCIVPQNDVDKEILDRYIGEYAHTAGRGALGALKKIDSRNRRGMHALDLSNRHPKWKILDDWLTERAHRMSDLIGPDVAQLIQEVNGVKGRSDEECEEILKKSLQSGRYWDWETATAWGTLSDRSPAKLLAVLADNYRPGTANIATLPPFAGPGDRIVKLIAEDPTNPARGDAALILFRATHDKRYVDTIKDAAMAAAYGGRWMDAGRAHYVLANVLAAHKEYPDAVDLEAFTGTLLQSANPQYVDNMRFIAGALGDASAGATPVLANLLDRPETIIPASYGAAGDLIRAEAAKALGRIASAGAADALMACLDGSKREANQAVARAAVDALGDVGDVRALPILEKILDGFGPADTSANSSDTDSQPLTRTVVHRAILMIEVKAAQDPCARFLSLAEADRSLFSAADLARRFSADQLRMLLPDDRCRDSRVRVYSALAQQLESGGDAR